MRFCAIAALILLLTLLVTSCDEYPIVSPIEQAVHPPTPFLAPILRDVLISMDSTIKVLWYDENVYGFDDSVTYVIEQADQSDEYHELAAFPRNVAVTKQWNVRRASDTSRTYAFRMRTIKGIDTSTRSNVFRTSYGPVLAMGGQFDEVSGPGGPSYSPYVSYLNDLVLWNGSRMNGVSGVGTLFKSPLAIHNANLLIGSVFEPNVICWGAGGSVSEQTGAAGGIGPFAEYKNDVYAGVRWEGIPYPGEHIVRRSESGWGTVGGGVAGPVYSLTVFQDELYAGGDFRSAEGKVANCIASWNGGRWSPVGSGLAGRVEALTVHNNRLHAAAMIAIQGGYLVYALFAWDGVVWTQVGPTFSGSVNFLISERGRLFAGGSISLTESGAGCGLIVLDDSTWREVTASSGAALTAVARYRGDVYFAMRQNGKTSVVITTELAPVWVFRERTSGWTLGPYVHALAVGSMWSGMSR